MEVVSSGGLWRPHSLQKILCISIAILGITEWSRHEGQKSLDGIEATAARPMMPSKKAVRVETG